MLKIVVVEDEEIIRKGLIFSINWLEMGCVVVGSASDGQEGLEVICDKKPDLVIADILMPRMSGLDMLEQAMRVCRFSSIVLTSYSEFDLAKRALQLGVTDYLLKPVDEDELRAVVEKVRQKIDRESPDRKAPAPSGEPDGEEGAAPPPGVLPGNTDPYVQQLCEIIRVRYMEKLSVNSVARELGISSSYLSRKIRSCLGITFVDLLNQYRINEATRLLRDTSLRIHEISRQVGFSEYKYFFSVFKKYTGVGPTEFIRENTGGEEG